MMDPFAFFYMFIVALIWGFTNAMMKNSSQGIEKCKSDSWIGGFLREIKFLITNWKYISSHLLNQSGSLLFYYTLGQIDLSIASPLTNTLTFIFTYLSGILFFGEKDEEANLQKKIGLCCVCAGVVICVLDKI